MPSLIEIIIAAADRSGPAFQSAAGNTRLLGAATDQTSARINVLTDRLGLQQRQLGLLERQLRETTAASGADSIAAQRQSIAYDRLTFSIRSTERELERLHDEQRTGAPIATLTTTVGGLGTAFGMASRAAAGLGIALGTQEIVQYGIEAGRLANTLETTDLVIRQVAQSTDVYNQTVALARQNQQLLGGSFEQNLSAFSATLPLVKEYNLQLETLNTLSLQLAQRRPSEAGQGAAFAISEFITGTGAEATLSLGDRFNLSRQRLLEIKNSGQTTEEQLRAVSEMLTEQGFGLDQLNERLDTTANTYARLGGAIADFRTQIGGLLANAFRPQAELWIASLQMLQGDVGGAQQTMRQADARIFGNGAQPARFVGPQGGTSAAPVTQVNVTVQGSVVTQQQLTDTIRRNLQLSSRRNGNNPVMP